MLFGASTECAFNVEWFQCIALEIDNGAARFLAVAGFAALLQIASFIALRWLGETLTKIREPVPSGSRRFASFRLLRIAPAARPEHIAAKQRVPLQPCRAVSDRVGIVRRILMLTLRPSSPKPAFLIVSAVEIVPEQSEHRLGEKFSGLRRLEVQMFPTEHPEHLRDSIKRRLFSASKTIAVCSASEACKRDPNPKLYTVNQHKTYVDPDAQDRVILVLLNPNKLAAEPDDTRDAIWLIAPDEPVPQEASAVDPDDKAQLCGFRTGHFDPWKKGLRKWRYLVLLPAFVVCGSMLVVGPLSYANADPLSWEMVAWLLIAEAWAVFLVPFVLWHLLRYWRDEHCRNHRWTATTIQCYEDGKELHRGWG